MYLQRYELNKWVFYKDILLIWWYVVFVSIRRITIFQREIVVIYYTIQTCACDLAYNSCILRVLVLCLCMDNFTFSMFLLFILSFKVCHKVDHIIKKVCYCNYKRCYGTVASYRYLEGATNAADSRLFKQEVTEQHSYENYLHNLILHRLIWFK